MEPAARPVVESWSCPTQIHAAVGAASRLPELASGRPVILVSDGALSGHPGVVAVVAGLIGTGRVLAQVARGVGQADAELLQSLCAVMQAHPEAAVVAVGGGRVLDVARVATLACEDPGFAPHLRAGLAVGAGVVFWPAPMSGANGVIAVPTTLGTAAEVSPVAVLDSGRGRVLCASPALRSRVAVLDPTLTAGRADRDLALGLLEPASRTIVPAIVGLPLRPADGLAAGLAITLRELAEELLTGTPDSGWRLAAALASAATHTSFLATGRSPFGQILWPFATELAGDTVPKPLVLARLLPAWLDGIESGALGPGFGTRARAVAILGQGPGAAAQRIRGWLGAAGWVDLPRPDARPETVAERVRAHWAGMFLPGISAGEIDWLVAAASRG